MICKHRLNSLLTLTCLLTTLSLDAQPYIDPFQIRHTTGFRSKDSYATPFTHVYAGSDLPLRLKENTFLLLSPFYESWNIDHGENKEFLPNVRSIALPVGLMLPLDDRWSLNVTPIIRTNGEQMFKDNTIQLGGVSFVSYAVNPQMKIRAGVYLNEEFFGLFVWPLLGADWKLGTNDYLFGLLPGRFTYEHRWSNRWYGGVTFRALTNSFRLEDGNFVRVDDNQFSLYVDIYPVRNWCVTVEPGYGIARKLRAGADSRSYFSENDMGDGIFIKLSTAYRIRL
ncbi:MAG: hypothetical protein RL021_958 [Bacteroidota bacterium]